jgi:anti-sigma B factor antagonist
MTIEERAVEQVAVLDLGGRLVLGDGDEALRHKIQALMTGGSTQVVLNLADVSYVDSAGLGSLVAVCLDARKHGGAIKLHSASKRLHDLFVMARLVSVLDISESESQALAGFGVTV